MSITIEQFDYYIMVKMPELVDASLAPKFHKLFDELLKDINRNIIIDFTDTSYLDSSGIGAIAYLFKRLHRSGLTLELIGLQRQPLKKIRTLRLDEVISITRKTHS